MNIHWLVNILFRFESCTLLALLFFIDGECPNGFQCSFFVVQREVIKGVLRIRPVKNKFPWQSGVSR